MSIQNLDEMEAQMKKKKKMSYNASLGRTLCSRT